MICSTGSLSGFIACSCIGINACSLDISYYGNKPPIPESIGIVEVTECHVGHSITSVYYYE